MRRAAYYLRTCWAQLATLGCLALTVYLTVTLPGDAAIIATFFGGGTVLWAVTDQYMEGHTGKTIARLRDYHPPGLHVTAQSGSIVLMDGGTPIDIWPLDDAEAAIDKMIAVRAQQRELADRDRQARQVAARLNRNLQRG